MLAKTDVHVVFQFKNIKKYDYAFVEKRCNPGSKFFLCFDIICSCLKTVKKFGNPSLFSNAPGMKVTQWRKQRRK